MDENLLKALAGIDRPGDIFAAGDRVPAMPGLEVEGLGTVGLPLSKAQARALIRRCRGLHPLVRERRPGTGEVRRPGPDKCLGIQDARPHRVARHAGERDAGDRGARAGRSRWFARKPRRRMREPARRSSETSAISRGLSGSRKDSVKHRIMCLHVTGM